MPTEILAARCRHHGWRLADRHRRDQLCLRRLMRSWLPTPITSSRVRPTRICARSGWPNPTGVFCKTPFSVAYRYKRIGTDTPTLRVQLMEGATSRASWDVAVSSDTFTDGEQFLTAAEFAAITDFTDLRVRFTAIRREDALDARRRLLRRPDARRRLLRFAAA